MLPQSMGVAVGQLDPNSTYDSVELKPTVNWCIERVGAPIGDIDADTNGFFAVSARFGPRVNMVMIGVRHYGPAVAFRALDEFAARHLRPYGIPHDLVFDQNIHVYPYIVLSLSSVVRWYRQLVSSPAAAYSAAAARPGLYTLPSASMDEFVQDASPNESRESRESRAEREYPDPHDTPYRQRAFSISATRLRTALGSDAYRHDAREGWHVEGRGRYAALRLGSRRHTLDDVKYVFGQYGIATRVAYDGYELSVDPDDVRNAPFRVA